MNTILLKSKVLVKVIYFMPDYNALLNEFAWQTDDVWPEIPRVHKFLNFWKENIEAKINNVYVAHTYSTTWRRLDGQNY